MVDFQSRDTRRGPTVDDDSESESDSSDAAASEDDATEADDAADTAGEGDGANSAGDATTADPETTAETERTEADTDPLADEAGGAADDTDPLAEEATGAADDTDPLAEEATGAADDTDPLADTAGSEDGAAEGGDTEAAATADDTATTPSDTEAAATAPPASKPTTPTRAVDVAVVTVGGDRAALEDAVTEAFEGAGHAVVRSERLRGGYDGIQQMVETLVGEDVEVVVTVGGVGLAADEMAIEAVHPLLEKALPGFGEAFRARLADHIGTGIVGVRSTAGLSDGTLVFCLPGDAEAAALAVREILATEAPILADQLS